MLRKGLIIKPSIYYNANPGTTRTLQESALDPQEIRFAILFWDEIDLPTTSFFNPPLSDDERFLSDAGILSRSLCDSWLGPELTQEIIEIMKEGLPSDNPGPTIMATNAIMRSTYEAFESREAIEPGKWSISRRQKHHMANSSGITIGLGDWDPVANDPTRIDEGRGALVSLYRAIPVPDRDVPLNDILEFRAKRKDELMSLRHHLADLYQKIVMAPDRALQIGVETERLEFAIANFVKSAKGMNFPWRLMDVQAKLTLDVKSGAALFAAITGSWEIATLVAASSLEISAGPSLRGGAAHGTPFEYVSAFHNDLFPLR